ncbi:MAG: hypothetical protein H0U76_28860 [Ktedonobacteraceae bacterium]|nr:hypothetical protein [Ktedonobacteraceae bacterium]MBA3944257.1 hypothetical protein [Herpetosiphonaceae bacterium]
MTTITLPPDIAEPLVEQACKQATTPELLAIDSLRALFALPILDGEQTGETLYEFLSSCVGTVDGTTEVLSENTGQHFTQGMADKQRQGYL